MVLYDIYCITEMENINNDKQTMQINMIKNLILC